MRNYVDSREKAGYIKWSIFRIQFVLHNHRPYVTQSDRKYTWCLKKKFVSLTWPNAQDNDWKF